MEQQGKGAPGECVVINGRGFDIRSIRVTNATTNKNVNVPDRCNGWTVENYGTTTAFVNDKPILPPFVPGTSGEAWGPVGNPGDYFTGVLQIKFEALTGGEIWITFYIYTC